MATTSRDATRHATLQLSERRADGSNRYPVTLSTETPVPRTDFYGERFNEVLSHKASAIDLSRAPLPLLEAHKSSAVNVGIVEGLRIVDAKLRGELVLGKSARAQELAADIDAGIVTGVSVGYVINAEEVSADGATRTATRWIPYELSLVGIPADINAGIGRSKPVEPKVEEKPVSLEGRAALVERERISGIRSAMKYAAVHVDQALGEQLIANGIPLDRARSMILDELAKRDEATEINGHYEDHVRFSMNAGGTADARWARGAQAALFERAGVIGTVRQATEMKKPGFENTDLDPAEFRGMTMLDLARESLERKGVRTRGMSRQNLMGEALTRRSGGAYAAASDFSVLLENAMGKILLASYSVVNDTWSKICKTELVPDFRASPRYRAGSFGPLDVLAENAEYTNKSIPDGQKTSISTETKGNIISISRQALVNDDLSAFNDLASRLGRAARLGIEAEFYALLAQNGGLGPTVGANPFFHSSNGNVNATGSALGVAALDADRVVMAAQKDAGNNDYLDLRPSVLLVPSSLGGQARVINEAQYDVTGSTAFQVPNRVRGLFREVVDTPRLSGTRRYLFAEPSIAPAFVVAFLEGSGEGPYLESDRGWRVDGIEWKCRIDFKVQAFDPKGACTNAGV